MSETTETGLVRWGTVVSIVEVTLEIGMGSTVVAVVISAVTPFLEVRSIMSKKRRYSMGREERTEDTL